MATTHGFELIKEATVEEYKTRARLFRHVQTGAELLSLENEDENKVFGVTLRTPPGDSTGLPHIMEHSVLCGSRKYPLKEPFVELLKGSLKTFLNAFTFPDKTCYPVASTNRQDFYNLVDVYLDAVFFPLIPPHVLQQEGWHYELEEPDGPMTYKGVVFNEMKGAYSSPDSLLYRYSQQVLFPDNPYGLDSGGDPKQIPNLTYEQFMTFHRTYYHPSNARIYFYGDDPPEERLRLVDEYLREFEASEIDSDVPLQAHFEQPRRLAFPYAAGEESDQKGYLTQNWLLVEPTSPELSLGLHMLGYILIGTPASPLRKALVDSGLGEDVTGAGVSSSLRQMYFSTGLKGIDLARAGEVEKLIQDTLRSLAEEGIEADMIEAAVNTTEFSLRENNTGGFPRGLSLMLRALSAWLHGRDPLEPLAFEAPLAAIKERLAAGERYFEALIQRYLLDNSHRVTLVLEPDPALHQREEAAEQERLAQQQAQMSQEELEAVVKNTHRLRELQEMPDPPEAVAAIPSLGLADLEPKNKLIPLEVIPEGSNTILYHDLVTNGIIYLDVGFNLHALPQELLPYVSLFSQALLEIGTEKEDFVRLSRRIGRKTGGIWSSSFISARRESETAVAWLFLRGKALPSQADDMLDIMRDVLLAVQLDNQERFKQMVLEHKAGLEASLVPAGHGVVDARLRSHFNEADWASEQMGGVSQLFFLRELVTQVDEEWQTVLEKLEGIRRVLLSREHLLCNVTTSGEDWQQFRPKLTAFMRDLPDVSMTPVEWEPDYDRTPEGLTIPAQVNYVGKGANLYQAGYELHGSVLPITNYLRTTWLWERVRMRGGAYGAFCSFDRHSGVFSFGSYRDPNLLGTLENYDNAVSFLRQAELDELALTRSIIGAIGQMDAYQLPDAKGYTSMLRYLLGESDDGRQQLREQILATRPEDFRNFGEALEAVRREGLVVVLGSPQAIAAANEKRPDWLKVTKVL